MDDPIEEAVGLLQHSCICFDLKHSPKRILESLQVLCYNSTYTIIECVASLLNCKSHALLHFPGASVHICISDLLRFKVGILYMIKFLQFEKPLSGNVIVTVQFILNQCMKMMGKSVPETRCLLEAAQILINTCGDQLDHETVLNMLAQCSQLMGSVQCLRKKFEDLVRLLTQLLPYKAKLSLLVKMVERTKTAEDVPCFLLSEVLLKIKKDDVLYYAEPLVCFVLNGFQSNIDGAQRVHIYVSLVKKLDFEEWKTFVYLPAFSKIKEHQSKDCFVQSVQKYFIPPAVQEYGILFYDFLRCAAFDPQISSYALLYSVKRSLCKPSDYGGDLRYFMRHANPAVRLLGLEILCIFKSKQSIIFQNYYDMILTIMDSDTWKQSISRTLKALRLFYSHMIITVNATINAGRTVNWNFFSRHLKAVCEFCLSRISVRCHLQNEFGFKLYYQMCELFLLDSSKLLTTYNLAATDKYDQRQNKLYMNLENINEWPFTSECNIKRLFENYVEYSTATYCPVDLANTFFEVDLHQAYALKEKALGLCNSVNSANSTKAAALYLIYLCSKIIDDHVVLNDIQSFTDLFKQKCKELFLCSIEEGMIDCPIHNYLKVLSMLNEYGILKRYDVDCSDVFYIGSDIIDYILRNSAPCIAFGSVPVQKTAEAALMEAMTYQFQTVCVLNNKEMKHVFIENCRNVITTSNMKRPVMIGATLLHQFCDAALKSDKDDVVLVSNFLEDVLNGLTSNVDVGKSRIRRSQENQLVVQSICSADKLPKKPLLNRAVRFLIKVAQESHCDGSVSAAIHCLEVLMSDNSVRESTQIYITDVSIICLEEFSNPSWRIRNAALQLWKTIVNRVVGQNARCNGMRKSTEEFFRCYPKLVLFIYKKLAISVSNEGNETVIPILALFSELHVSTNVFTNEPVAAVQAFVKLFMHILLSASGTVGLYAGKAYVSHTYPEALFSAIYELISFINIHFHALERNILCNLLGTIRILYIKYKMHFTNVSCIDKILCDFGNFLRSQNYRYRSTLFPLLFIVSCSPTEAEKEFTLISERGVMLQHRAFLYLNLPYIIETLDVDKIVEFVQKRVTNDLPVGLFVSCLESVTARLIKDASPTLLRTVIEILISKLFLKNKLCTYLRFCLIETIFLLYEHCPFFSASQEMGILDNSLMSSVHDVSINTLILSIARRHDQFNNKLLCCILKCYKQAILEDCDLAIYVSSVLLYLFRCCRCNRQKIAVFNLAVNLLLNRETEEHICNFASNLFEESIPGPADCLRKLLSYRKLIKCFDDSRTVLRYLISVCVYICRLPNHSHIEEGFYDAEGLIQSIPNTITKKIIFSSFKEYLMCSR